MKDLKHVDPAIVHLSANEYMLTRYDRANLMEIRDERLSQEPPRCFYDPNIIKLNILKFRRNNSIVDEQVEIFREKLKNLQLDTGFDPDITQLLRNYHNAILNPPIQMPSMTINLKKSFFLTCFLFS
jgi:hypothetical protein